MKNTVLKRFVHNKLEKNISSNSTFGDIMSELDRIESIAVNSSKLKPVTSTYLIQVCHKKKEIIRSLFLNQKFVHLTSYKIFKLSQLKEKLSPEQEFEISDSLLLRSP